MTEMDGLDTRSHHFGHIRSGKTGQGRDTKPQRWDLADAPLGKDVIYECAQNKIPDKNLHQKGRTTDKLDIGYCRPF